MQKYVCIHGHFYQPPRENAWLEHVEIQESAYPYHDWNARITYECYAANAVARILNENGQISAIRNNYRHISHNFGPTLLSWMKDTHAETYSKIIEADTLSRAQFGGHGAAMAQVYSHLIMPLANARDKETQVVWGIRDFESRYGRYPEGMWLAETAVDTATLEVLAAHGIKYTILAPRQAKAVKKISEDPWYEVDEHSLDTRRAYQCHLPSGATIALFFYDGPISKDIAFNGLLNNGIQFAHRLLENFTLDDEPQLVHVATDGETYGHHHRYGEMALADCINYLEERADVEMTVYGEFLEKHPPTWEVQIHENSSWSCVHGIERWRSNCGCHTGGKPHYHQQWRKPLRDSLDWLRTHLIDMFEEEGPKLLTSPWNARNEYLTVVKDRNHENVQSFINEHATEFGQQHPTRLLRLLESQRQAMQMYTSCGWFFNEISGIETTQILQYAVRAISFIHQIQEQNLLPEFQERLAEAPSNVMDSGARVLKKKVMPSVVTLERVGVHIAAGSLFAPNPAQIQLYNYTARNYAFERQRAGNFSIALGQANVKSRITWSEKHFSFAVLHLGNQQMVGHISTNMSEEDYEDMKERVMYAFSKPDIEHVLVIMQSYFGNNRFSFRDLFQDEKHAILRQLAEAGTLRAERVMRELYVDNFPLTAAMRSNNLPVPITFVDIATIVLNADLHSFFSQPELYVPKLRNTINQLLDRQLEISEHEALRLAINERLLQEVDQLVEQQFSLEQFRLINSILEQIARIEVGFDPWQLQNRIYNLSPLVADLKLDDSQWLEWEELKSTLEIA